MASVAVIGAGPMGLATAYHLGKAGHHVTIYEKDAVVGGMTASFDFDGIEIERYYHFICGPDEPYFELLRELELENQLRWTDTHMGYFHEGRLKDWGDPVALLKFPGLSLLAKIRYGLMAFAATKRKNWQPLDGLDAVSWLRRWLGDEAYNVLWKPLFELKFHRYTGNLSAAWIWSRMRRVGVSRRSIFQEQMGYLEGGSATLLNGLVRAIEGQGGTLRLRDAACEIVIENGVAIGVRGDTRFHSYDKVVSTVPMPYVSALVPKLPEAVRARYDKLSNIAVVCVLVKLNRPFTKYFWLNICDPKIQIPGLIEYSNLRSLDKHIIYAPFYMPADHTDYQRPNSWFVESVRTYMHSIDPSLSDEDILAIKAGRYEYAQPICPPEFLDSLPPIQPDGVANLLIADTSYYYPEDRSISESIELGKTLARMCDELPTISDTVHSD